MKKILAISKKDIIVRFASKSEWVFFIILPMLFTFLLAGGAPSGEDDPRIRLLVVDEANTPISRQLIGQLENSTAVRPELTTRGDAQDQFDQRRASTVFIIPAGMDPAQLQNGSAQVELLQQPNNMNAIVARARRADRHPPGEQLDLRRANGRQAARIDPAVCFRLGETNVFRSFAQPGTKYSKRGARARNCDRRQHAR